MTTELLDHPTDPERTANGRLKQGHRLLARKATSTDAAVHVPYSSWAPKLKLLTLDDIDLRTKEGRRIKQTVAEREAAMGGDLSEEKFQDLVTLVVYEALREHMNVMRANGDPTFDLNMFHMVNKDIHLLKLRL
jgi:hypothetical protein